MSLVVHNKLVRDKIPQIISTAGATPHTRILNEDEYRQELLRKLIEEAKELLESNDSIDERADVEEVLRTIDITFGYDAQEISQVRTAKASERGGFEKHIYLESTEEPNEE